MRTRLFSALFLVAVLAGGCAAFETTPEDIERKVSKGGQLTPGVSDVNNPNPRGY
jgi:hypothetical protein